MLEPKEVPRQEEVSDEELDQDEEESKGKILLFILIVVESKHKRDTNSKKQNSIVNIVDDKGRCCFKLLNSVEPEQPETSTKEQPPTDVCVSISFTNLIGVRCCGCR